MSMKHLGSSIDDFLKEEGILDEAQAEAVKEVVAWQLAEAMKKEKVSRRKWRGCSRPAARKSTAWVDPRNDVTLSSLQRAAAMIGRRVRIELV